jgi:ERCC4-type nuclease
MTPPPPPAVRFPGVILVDDREKLPYTFAGFRCDAREKYAPLVVDTRVTHLETGDYTVEGCERRVTVERKGGIGGLADLYHTLGTGRDRFERELRRMAGVEKAFVVVEADWMTVIRHPPELSRLHPKTVYRSVIAWQQRFANVHWWFCPNRRFAEVTTLRILERFLRDERRKKGGGGHGV